MDANNRQFENLLGLAERYERMGRLEAAVVFAQAAAQQAWLNPGGIFASPALEALLGRVARSIDNGAAASPPSGPVHNVLHVVTQAYQTGGSTQFVASWVDQDDERSHSVCLTRQRTVPLPEKLTRRIDARVQLVRVDDRRGGLLRRAAALRNLAREFDVILVHSHPYDVVPILAFAGRSAHPPVIFVNHADHVFWVGVSITDVLLNMRVTGAELAARRRGIELTRSTLMYRPLQLAGRRMSRAEAKRALGIPEDQLLVVTAADGAKYVPLDGPSLLAMVLPVFESDPHLAFLAAGPSAEGEWAEAAQRTDGRARALGMLPDVSVLHQAADLYLDSYPFSSLTSMMEAGSFGTPMITFRGHPRACSVLGADTHGLDELMQTPADPPALRDTITRLLADDQLRASLGEQTRIAIVESHTGNGWRRAAQELYDRAGDVGEAPQPCPVARENGRLDQMLELVMARTSYSSGEQGAVRDNLGLLPAAQRLMAAVRLWRSRRRPQAQQLIPEWSLSKLADLRRGLRMHRAD